MPDSKSPPASASPGAPPRDMQIAVPVLHHAPGSQSISAPRCDSPQRDSQDPRNRHGCLIQTSLGVEEMQEQYEEPSARSAHKRNSSGPQWRCRSPDDGRYTCTQSRTVSRVRESAEWIPPASHNSIPPKASAGNDHGPLASHPSSLSAKY